MEDAIIHNNILDRVAAVSGFVEKVVMQMKKTRELLLLVFILVMCVVMTGCSKNTTSSGNMGETVSAAHEYTSKDYGFSFKYNNLTLDSKVDGDRYAKLTHADGDTAEVKIFEPDKSYGDPEEWLTKSDNTLQHENYQTRQLKLGKYKARLEDYAWKVGGKPLRTNVLTAYKDGLYYELIVTMKEENVKISKPEFDVVINSFALADTKVDLAALKPWKSQLPAAYPLDVIDLYGIDKIHAVVGDKLEPGKGFISVHYYVKKSYSADQIAQMFKDALQDSQDFKFADNSDLTRIRGVKAGYQYDIKIMKFSTGGINMVKVEVSKPR